jgi:hypothetical protein
MRHNQFHLRRLDVIQPGQPELFESGWLLESAPTTNVPLPTSTQHPLFLSFDKVATVAFVGCNGIGAPREKTIYNKKLGLLMISTMGHAMGCADWRFETSFTTALSTVLWYQSDGKVLTLLDAFGNPIAVYRRDDTYIGYRLTN